jgi:hypothetical protein
MSINIEPAVTSNPFLIADAHDMPAAAPRSSVVTCLPTPAGSPKKIAAARALNRSPTRSESVTPDPHQVGRVPLRVYHQQREVPMAAGAVTVAAPRVGTAGAAPEPGPARESADGPPRADPFAGGEEFGYDATVAVGGVERLE